MEKNEIKVSPTKENKEKGPIKEEGQLALDIFQSKDEFVIIAPIAGLLREDIEIMINEDVLVIKGERKYPGQVKDKDFLVKECYFGPFSRAIILPREADLKSIKATFEKNILEIKIKKDKSFGKQIVEIE
ncbi:MAG: Hsp20/alpha crystallin family protein [Candidatus Gracilibacteria bacterium]|jgi:HSP20 family protein|nr:Hsp20/alpha crystallin family protein [Candidatus Gracilibacteria bacterium]